MFRELRAKCRVECTLSGLCHVISLGWAKKLWGWPMQNELFQKLTRQMALAHVFGQAIPFCLPGPGL